MNYKLKPGDTATVEQENGEILTIRAYGQFTMVQTDAWGKTLEVDSEQHFVMTVKVIEKKTEEPGDKL